MTASQESQPPRLTPTHCLYSGKPREGQKVKCQHEAEKEPDRPPLHSRRGRRGACGPRSSSHAALTQPGTS